MTKPIFFAILAAALYALNSPFSKLLLQNVPPTMMAGFLYLGAGIGMALMGEAEGVTRDVTPSLVNVIVLFFIGIIASATMIVPGVSGSMILLVLGYYNPVITAIKDFLSALAHFDMPGILRGIGILLPFGIGIIVGIFAIAKLIEMLFEKFPLYTYWAIIGLLVASPIAVWMAGDMGVISVGAVIASVITLAAGFVISMKLGE